MPVSLPLNLEAELGWEDSKEHQKWNFGLDCKQFRNFGFDWWKASWIPLDLPERFELARKQETYWKCVCVPLVFVDYPLTCSIKWFLNRGDNLLLNCSKLTDWGHMNLSDYLSDRLAFKKRIYFLGMRVTNCPSLPGTVVSWDSGSAKTGKVLGKLGWVGHLRLILMADLSGISKL